MSRRKKEIWGKEWKEKRKALKRKLRRERLVHFRERIDLGEKFTHFRERFHLGEKFTRFREKFDSREKPVHLGERLGPRKKLLLILAGSLAGLVLLVVISFGILRTVGRNRLLNNADSDGPDLTAMEENEAEADNSEEISGDWQEGWVRHDGKIYAYNEDIMTFLIMGIDKNSDAVEVAEGTNGGQADGLFLAVMNPHNKTISIVCINRNAMTEIELYDENGDFTGTYKAQICVQHGFGNGVEESCEYQKKAVQRLFYGLPIHGYAAINMSAIQTVNDAVGGVDVTVLDDVTKKDSTLVKGAQVHLMGESAFWYVKYRDITIFGSADGRLARQKQYLNAFITKMKAAVKENPTVVIDLYNAVQAQMVTDITLDEATYLASIAADYHFDNNSFYMMQGETVQGEQFEEFYVDENALYEMILEVFYEEVEEQGQ